MSRELKDIKLKEVSLVDKAANKKGFLFFKQEGKPTKTKKLKKKINIVIDSDGTIGGTKIAVNKDELKNLKDFSFSFWGNDDDSRAVSCSYSKFVETEDGFSRSETFYLSKGDNQMDSKIQEKLQEYFGEDEKVDFEKAEESDVVVKSLATINEYQGEFPPDLKKAVGVIAKQAGMYIPQVEQGEGKDTEGITKAGAKFSKETFGKIKAAVEALKALEGVLPQETKKSDNDDENDELKKTISELTKSIEQLKKKKDDDTKDELLKSVKGLKAQVKVLEEGTGVRKSEDGQDDDGDNDSSESKWPSISG